MRNRHQNTVNTRNWGDTAAAIIENIWTKLIAGLISGWVLYNLGEKVQKIDDDRIVNSYMKENKDLSNKNSARDIIEAKLEYDCQRKVDALKDSLEKCKKK